jgi:CHAT domain-containing protein
MLMQEFYRRLGDGLAPAAALRESALAVRAKYQHPFYWAPFVVTGRN